MPISLEAVTKLLEDAEQSYDTNNGEAQGIDDLIKFIDEIAIRGYVVFLKVDGVRGPDDNPPYTSIISGNELDKKPIRIDGESLRISILRSLRAFLMDSNI